jgi:hypothetical protein
MKKFIVPAFVFFLASSCNQNRSAGPDVSGIKLNTPIDRFDRDFFSLDTLALQPSLNALQKKYPSLLPVFLNNGLGLNDSTLVPGLSRFIRLNQFIQDSVNKVFPDTEELEKDFNKAFQHVKYYFPEYPLPRLIALVGPVDLLAQTSAGELTPDFMGPGFLAISLQFYLGKDFGMYRDEYFVANVAPEYRSRRFDKKYIVADAMKLVTDDLFPDKSRGMGLAVQMIEKGKQWWLLDKFLPAVPDSVKTGYTQNQLDWCRENEGMIWNQVITSEKNIFTNDPAAIQNYIGEAPFTQTMPPASPGNIGPWIGWQIVKKFEEKNESLSITDIMKADAKKILEETKYKPR